MDAVATVCKGILIVEDDHEIRRTITDILRDEGYAVAEASNGQEALVCLRKTTASGQPLPCMILLDLMMPVMDGWQFRKLQASDPALTGIPVILLSADGNARQKALTMKVQLGLNKPIKLDVLLNTVAQFC